MFNVLLQVLDDGRLTDGQGRTVDFTNTVLIMTSNLPGDPQDFFKPEFLNRIDEIVRFRHLSEADIRRIVDIQVATLAARLAERRLTLEVTDAAKDWLAGRATTPTSGPGPLRRLIQRRLRTRWPWPCSKGATPTATPSPSTPSPTGRASSCTECCTAYLDSGTRGRPGRRPRGVIPGPGYNAA